MHQRLRILPGAYVIELVEDAQGTPTDRWLAMVRAPEGLTVIREADEQQAVSDDELWVPLYSGGTAHGLDVPGVLAALLAPLAAAGVPVFVASTYDADLIFVPRARLGEASRALIAVGHHLTDAAPVP